MQEYLVLLFPLFLTLYFERSLHAIYPRRFSILMGIVMCNAVIQLLLQVTGIQDMEHMVSISAAAVCLACAAAIASLIQYDYKNKSYQTVLSVAAILILISGGAANVIMNTLFDHNHANEAGQ